MQRVTSRVKSLLTAVAASILVIVSSEAVAQPLVVDGETIADAKLFADAKREGKLLVYGVLPTHEFDHIKAEFTKDTGIAVEQLRLPTTNLLQRIRAEFATGRLMADFADSTDIPAFEELFALGVIEPYKTPNFNRLKPTLRHPEGHWYAELYGVQVLAVNTGVVKEADFPKNWRDLFDPKWKGLIGFPNPELGGAAFSGFLFLKERVDRDAWKKLAANNARIYPAVVPTMQDLLRGEIALAMTDPGHPVKAMQDGSPIRMIIPSEGVAAFLVGGGVVKTARNPNAAKLWLNWITSKRGGSVVAHEGWYPNNPDAPTPSLHHVQFPAPETAWAVDMDWLKTNRPALMDEYRATFRTR